MGGVTGDTCESTSAMRGTRGTKAATSIQQRNAGPKDLVNAEHTASGGYGRDRTSKYGQLCMVAARTRIRGMNVKVRHGEYRHADEKRIGGRGRKQRRV